MATSNRFNEFETPLAVDVELKKLLCCEYLHEQSNKDNFTKFKLNCRRHLKTPAEKQLSIPVDILDKLEEKSIIGIGDYGKLKDLVKDIDSDIVSMINEAEERISSFDGKTDGPSPKRRKIGMESDTEDLTMSANWHLVPLENEEYETVFRRLSQKTLALFQIGIKIISDHSLYKEFAEKCERYRETMDLSVRILRLFYYLEDEDKASSKAQLILGHAEEGEKHIMSTDQFHICHENWKKYNRLLQNQISTILLLSKKGAELRKLMSGSILFLLSFESKDKKEEFISEYHSGTLQQEVEETLITEHFLEFFKLKSAKLLISIDVKDSLERIEHYAQIEEQLSTSETEADRHGSLLEEDSRHLATSETEADRHGTRLEEHGGHPAISDTEAYRHGTLLEEDGRHLAASESEADRYGTLLEEHGGHPATSDTEAYKHGTLLEEHGGHPATSDTEADRHGTLLEEHGGHLARSDTEADSHGSQFEKHSRHLDKFETEADKHGVHIEEHCRHTKEHGTQLEEHVRLDTGVDWHAGQLDENYRHLDRLDTEAVRHATQLEEHGRHIKEHDAEVEEHAKQISDIKEQLETIQIESDEEPDASKLKQRLMKVNEDITRVITLSPLQDRGRELPIELLFAQVVIREDQKHTEKGDNSDSRFVIDTSNPVSDHGKDRRSDTDSYSDDDRLSKTRRELVNPYDVFKTDDEISNIIYMLGDAAHGKTTYCLWLAKKWCNAQREDSLDREFDVWERALKEFDFVFLLQFRNVNPNRACAVDMICHDVSRSLKGCHAAIRHVLSSEKYRSFVIMDGLDEWKPNDQTIKQLTCQGMPNLDELSSTVTTFISMRPWVFALISKLVQDNDIVTEILGLSETGMENVIKNVLINHYELTENTSKFNDIRKRIRMNLKEKSLKSFMQIPLLAVVCVQIWCEGKQIGNSMTSLYAEMLDMLIERANEKHELEIEHKQLIYDRLPELLLRHENVRSCISVLLKLGKVAYEGLISKKTNLVLQKRKLEKKIGKRDLQFTLDVGLISQKEAPSLLDVSVHFFHKSIQEFLAANYIVRNKEVGESFCNHLSCIKVIMEMSNVIRFICGMCPSLGSVISQHVISVTDSDIEICRYRELHARENTTVKELYKLQVSWNRELRCGQTESPMVFNVSDIYLGSTSSIETVMGTRELLHGASENIKSLHLWWVPIDEELGVTNMQLENVLSNKDNTKSLTKVIVCGGNGRTLHPISQPTHLRYLYLCNLKINNTSHYGNSCPQLLNDMPLLRELYLFKVTLNEKGLYLSADMVHIKMVTLESVNMSAALWQQFILSVLNIQHRFDVELSDTNIDYESESKIRSSVDFNVTQDGLDDEYKYKLNFTRVWPLLHTTRYDDDGNEILYTRL